MSKVTKLEKLGEVYSDWNERKISGDQAMARIQALFPRVTLKVWNSRINKTFKEAQ
jgi:hypothetical protein